jgi:hypothetical protein
MTGHVAVEQYLYLMEQAFDGNDEHSLMANMRSVTEADWDWTPPDGSRSIRDIVGHVAGCKYMYENHAFGDATLTWDHPAVHFREFWDGPPGPTGVALEWLAAGHRRLLQSVAALDDDELRRPRRTSWGSLEETRWIISVMIEHDLYHAGEINHLRSLHHRADRWAFEE